MAQMLEIVAKMGAEMRKPSDREQQKIDKEDAQVSVIRQNVRSSLSQKWIARS